MSFPPKTFVCFWEMLLMSDIKKMWWLVYRLEILWRLLEPHLMCFLAMCLLRNEDSLGVCFNDIWNKLFGHSVWGRFDICFMVWMFSAVFVWAQVRSLTWHQEQNEMSSREYGTDSLSWLYQSDSDKHLASLRKNFCVLAFFMNSKSDV